MSGPKRLIPPHGGYRKLESVRLAQLIYDVTARFCDRYIDRRSRTHDQMVQAARSGTQNIGAGSQASGTSKKTELKLAGVARSSLEELRMNYQDFPRQRGRTRMLTDGHGQTHLCPYLSVVVGVRPCAPRPNSSPIPLYRS